MEILGGVLSGAAIAGQIGNMYSDLDRPQNVGHWMLAIDIAHFLPPEQFLERIGSLATEARDTTAAPGFDRVLVPGEPEEDTRRRRLEGGIDIPEAVLSDLEVIGRQAGIRLADGVV